MGVRVAYGNKNKIWMSIQNGIIPNDCFIITRDEEFDAELLFYDAEGKLKQISTKSKFDTIEEAAAYVAANMVEGNIITCLEDGKYNAYVIQPDGKLSPVSRAMTDPDEAPASLTKRVELLEDYSHAHGNKIILDTISQEMVDFWSGDLAIGRVVQSPEDVIILNGNHLM